MQVAKSKNLLYTLAMVGINRYTEKRVSILEEKKFDLWSDGYEIPVQLQQDNDEYPFAGYRVVLEETYRMIRSSAAKKILNVGFGTGLVMKKLYQDGYELYGVDISEQLAEAGRAEMPQAKLVVGDYSLGLPLSLIMQEYDIAISVYGMHHLDNYEQTKLVRDILRVLKPGGMLIIGGLAYETFGEMKEFRKQNREKWLYKGGYTLYDELDKVFENVTWKKISKCAGIVTITKE